LVTGATGSVGTELIKQLSYSNAIIKSGVYSDKNIDNIRKISSRSEFVELD
jgi:FlaA1/EpsC-like NDP-sugar epimerase